MPVLSKLPGLPKLPNGSRHSSCQPEETQLGEVFWFGLQLWGLNPGLLSYILSPLEFFILRPRLFESLSY